MIKKIIIFVCKVKKMLGVVFILTFALFKLFKGKVPKMLILTCVPILDTQCQLWGHKQGFELADTCIYETCLFYLLTVQ